MSPGNALYFPRLSGTIVEPGCVAKSKSIDNYHSLEAFIYQLEDHEGL